MSDGNSVGDDASASVVPASVVHTIVVDASAVVDLLVNGRPLPTAGALATPAHLDAEVLSALGRLHGQGVLTVGDVEEMLEDLVSLPVDRVPIGNLGQQAFAMRDNVALRDGLYVAVAQALGCPLSTTDARLARACADHELCAVSGSTP